MLGQSIEWARDSIRIAVVARVMSAKTCPSVTRREPLSSRSCLSRTNTQEITKSDVATMRPSSTSRRGVRREVLDNSTKAAIAPIG